ncbi:nucleoside hydrolase [Microlunatus flavus]|uniref:Inosine-uridine nucleoside N-ribohydrolase n=1 Tax=Microlunatus flavus TaxID=1036181 RepID=A0A1H9JIZ7_9ACTN|nr:nucleoside hydrolase [Microlunatus flavus]SEQ86718.1 Inosine-uridine nucleoside N-ribohydrolase [Microlunatus flavus]
MPRIILDTDLAMGAPGSDIDDGFALALAHADPDITLELITTVNGNTDVESATILTAELARRLDLGDVPVVKGAAAALTRPQGVRRPADHVEALRATVAPPTPGYAAAAIAELVMANPGEITVVAIGPLTNVAAALSLEPRLAQNVREIVIMGGVFFQTMPTRDLPGEFNVWVDPEAAQAVLRSGMPQRWVGLDVTLQVRLTREHARRMLEADSPFAPFAGESTLAWIDHVAARNPGNALDADSCAMHDPLAMAVVSRPDLVELREVALDVVTGEGPARGVMITDVRESADPPPANARVAAAVDVDAFTEHFLQLITGL